MKKLNNSINHYLNKLNISSTASFFCFSERNLRLRAYKRYFLTFFQWVTINQNGRWLPQYLNVELNEGPEYFCSNPFNHLSIQNKKVKINTLRDIFVLYHYVEVQVMLCGFPVCSPVNIFKVISSFSVNLLALSQCSYEQPLYPNLYWVMEFCRGGWHYFSFFSFAPNIVQGTYKNLLIQNLSLQY